MATLVKKVLKVILVLPEVLVSRDLRAKQGVLVILEIEVKLVLRVNLVRWVHPV